MWSTLALAALAATPVLSSVIPAEAKRTNEMLKRADSKLVFAHFMIGIVSDRTGPADYTDDITRAKSIGIDAFALNIGTDGYTDTQLGYAYEAAANNDFNVFISFDFNWYDPNSAASQIGSMMATYAAKPAHLKIGGVPLFSSFAGDALDVPTMRSAAGIDLLWMPNYQQFGDNSNIDGALSWLAWPENGKNKAPDGWGNNSVWDSDKKYTDWLAGKDFIAPASAWFSTHFGPEVSYSKNFIFPSDLLWYYRWQEILEESPEFVEIVTWNDYGESHYIAPLSSPHTDDGSSKWVNDMPHDAWLSMAIPFIKAYKDGAASVDSYITDETIIYWYRQTSSQLDCDATDTTAGTPANNDSGNYFEGRPYGYQEMADNVFVVTLLKSAGTLQVNSGGTLYTVDVPAGAAPVSVPFATGAQDFALLRDGAVVMQDTSLKAVTDVCPCGIYNFNAYTGSVPAQDYDALQADGMAALTQGLKVTNCSATPSLPATPPATQAPTTTITAQIQPTVLHM